MNRELQPLPICNHLIDETRAKIAAKENQTCDITHLNALTSEFADHFSALSCVQIESVPITAKLDPSVRFIGAPISVMKPLFLEARIPRNGAFMVQNCVRTRGVNSLFDPMQVPKYGSFFTGLCVLVEYQELSALGGATVEFLTKRLGVAERDICINVNEEDADLSATAKSLEIEHTTHNEKPANYYRHKYGIEGVRGRNFNFGLRSIADDLFEDIGNLIVIENQDGPIGVELALGDTTILKQLYGLEHILDSYGLTIAPSECPDGARRKLEDAIITCLALFREGLRPSASNNQTRLLRSYVKALCLYRNLLDISPEELHDYLGSIETGALPFEAGGVSTTIMEHLDIYEKRLFTVGPANKEDEAILVELG